MIPVIDFKGPNVLDKIEEAYTTVGFAVFTNSLLPNDEKTMNEWFEQMKSFFQLDLEIKKQLPSLPNLIEFLINDAETSI